MDDETFGYVLAAHCPPYAGWWVTYMRLTEREFLARYNSELIAIFETRKEALEFGRKMLGCDTALP